MEKIERQSLLYKSGVEYADFCLNHVEGCSHGCRFPCYAMMMAKRFGKIKSYEEWCKPKLVENALDILDREIPRYKDKINFVHLCFTTDPFMYRFPEVADMSLKIIEKLNENCIRCTVLTKGLYPTVLANEKIYGDNNEYGITIVSNKKEFKDFFEPNSAPYSLRIKALKRLHEEGLKTWVSIEPYPTPNLVEQDLSEILESVSFVDRIIFGKLNYNVKSSTYQDNDAFYEDRAKEVLSFCKKNGIACHIKFGTRKEYNPVTAKIFRNK